MVVAAQPHYPNGPWGHNLPTTYYESDGVLVVRVTALPISHAGGTRHLVQYFYFALIATWACILKVRRTDATWCVSPNYLSIVPAIFSRFFCRSKIILETVDLWPEALVSSGYLRKGLVSSVIQTTCNLSYKLSDCVTTLTDDMRNMIAKAGTKMEKILILPNFVDHSIVQRAKSYGPRPSYYSGKFVVIYSGNIGPIYDFDVLLEAAARIKDETILIVIRGSGERASEVSEQASRARLSNVVFLGPSTRIDGLHHVAWSDVCVLPLRAGYEQSASFPIKLLEYLALAKPVVAFAEGSIANLISSYNAGVVLRPGDCVGFADTITKMKGDSEWMEALSTNASQLSNVYTLASFKKGVASVLGSLN